MGVYIPTSFSKKKIYHSYYFIQHIIEIQRKKLHVNIHRHLPVLKVQEWRLWIYWLNSTFSSNRLKEALMKCMPHVKGAKWGIAHNMLKHMPLGSICTSRYSPSRMPRGLSCDFLINDSKSMYCTQCVTQRKGETVSEK